MSIQTQGTRSRPSALTSWVLVAQTHTSWNRILTWLHQMELLRQSGKFPVSVSIKNEINPSQSPFYHSQEGMEP
jgi:hypothetical protein